MTQAMESTSTGSHETETSRDQRRRELREKIARRRAIDRAKRMDLYATDDRRVRSGSSTGRIVASEMDPSRAAYRTSLLGAARQPTVAFGQENPAPPTPD